VSLRRRLRVATLNIHKGLSQFNRRIVIHELREGLRLLNADIVFLQEVQGLHERHALRFSAWPAQSQHEFLAGQDWQHVYGRNAIYEHGHHGNAVLSRWPVTMVANHDVSNHRFEHRGLLHCRVQLPGPSSPLDCFCVHLSLHERGRRRQLETLAEHVTGTGPAVIAGDFNDWRLRAGQVLDSRLGFREAVAHSGGRHARTFPSILPVLSLDRIYVRGLDVIAAQVHRGKPWRLLSDHLALSADLDLQL